MHLRPRKSRTEEFLNYIIIIKFSISPILDDVYKSLYIKEREREREREKCQVIHETKLRDDSVWGGIF